MGQRTIDRSIARNPIDVRVDDLDKLGDVLDAANSRQNTSISDGPEIRSQNQQAAEASAAAGRRVAMARAQATQRRAAPVGDSVIGEGFGRSYAAGP